MSKKNSKNTNVIWTLAKTGCIMIACTGVSLLLINILAAYQIAASLLLGASATVLAMK